MIVADHGSLLGLPQYIQLCWWKTNFDGSHPQVSMDHPAFWLMRSKSQAWGADFFRLRPFVERTINMGMNNQETPGFDRFHQQGGIQSVLKKSWESKSQFSDIRDDLENVTINYGLSGKYRSISDLALQPGRWEQKAWVPVSKYYITSSKCENAKAGRLKIISIDLHLGFVWK